MAVILFSMITYLSCAPFAIAHLDLSRDIGVALGIANAERWPLHGPALNWTLHLGPVWYYLLAVPLWLTHSWIVVVMTIGVIAALKFPIAYALGSRLVDSRFGVLWVVLLALPGWNSLEVLLMEHTSFVATCVLGFLWMLLRYSETGSARYLYGLSILYALSLHAHPSTLALLLVATPFVLRSWSKSPTKWRELAIAVFMLLVPFLPFIASQIASGSPDIRSAVDYLSSAGGLGSFSDFPATMRGIFVTGPELIAKSVLRLDDRWAVAYTVFYGLLWATAIVGLVSSAAARPTRNIAMIGATTVVAIAVSVVLIRSVTPYYMSFVILVLLLGLAALGLRAATALPGIRSLAYLLATGAAVLPIVVSVGAARTFSTGSYPFAIFPLFDIKRPYVDGPPLAFVPAYAIGTIGDALCESRSVVAHGALAFHLLTDYALETRLQCAAPTAVRLGGSEPADATHVAGVSRTLLRKLPMVSAKADRTAGPLAFFRVSRVLSPTSGESTAAPGTYPPTPYTFGPSRTLTLQFDARCDEIVIVTNMYYVFAPDPKIVAVLNGKTVQPAAADALSTAYVCENAAAESPARWSLQLTAPDPNRVDVITIVARPH
jgi:hypothetical protein